MNALPVTAAPLAPRARVDARRIGRLALRSLHAELALYPKPGLVSLVDCGAHRDMDASTFMRSLFALRHYYGEIARAGADDAPFSALRTLGQTAEARMLRATGGINTHRGAIFMLGLLAAAAGALQERAEEVCDRSLRGLIRQRWSRDLCAGDALPTHGRWVALRYGAAGARGEAVHAFPGVFEIALPALRDALARGAGDERARLHALFSVLARVADTNLLYRGGPSGLDWMQAAAGAFLAGGSVFAAGWRERALAVHRACIARNLSPGGCADLLAAACFVHSLQGRGQ